MAHTLFFGSELAVVQGLPVGGCRLLLCRVVKCLSLCLSAACSKAGCMQQGLSWLGGMTACIQRAVVLLAFVQAGVQLAVLQAGVPGA